MKKQNGDSKELLLKKNTSWKAKLLDKISVFPKQKRTLVKRKQAAINHQSLLPPKTNGKELKRRRGRPSKSAQKQSTIKKTSTLTRGKRVDDGVDQKKQTSPCVPKEVNARSQLRPLLSLLPKPQPLREKSPPFMNIMTCGTNYKGKEIATDETDNVFNYGGISSKDEYFMWDFDGTRKSPSSLPIMGSATALLHSQQPPQLRNDNGVIKIQEPVTPLPTWDTLHEYMKLQRHHPIQPLPKGGQGQPEFRLQDYAESLYGKEFFLNTSESLVVGPHTAMMVIAQNPHCHDALKTLMKATHSPSPSATHNHQYLSSAPAFMPNPMPQLPPRMMTFGLPNFPGNYPPSGV